MKKLKKGDRVALYYHDAVKSHRVVGTVLSVRGESVRFESDDRQRATIHRKQCRKLVPKQRPGTWAVVDANGGYYLYPSKDKAEATKLDFDEYCSDLAPHRVVFLQEVSKK